MSAPPPYVVFQDYNVYQTTHQLPGPALQGVDLNTEFNRLKATTDALINNLGLIQRSDGALNNKSVSPDTITSSLAILIANWAIKGAWVTATAYALKDYVTNGGNGYVCIVAHTGGTFDTDLAAGKWALVSTIGATGPQGVQGATGATGPVVPMYRNRFINGDFAIDQRLVGGTYVLVSAGTTQYVVDRWYAGAHDSSGGSFFFNQASPGSGQNKFSAFFQGGSSTNLTTVFGQKIESANCSDLNNQNVCVSATIYSSFATQVTWSAYRAGSADNWGSRVLIATGTINITASPANYNFTFNCGLSASNGVGIEFTTGPILTVASTLNYENLQFELGTTPTAFERRLRGPELLMCQRHCLVRRATAAGQLNIAGARFTTPIEKYADRFPVEMFKAPALTFSANADFQYDTLAATVACSSLTAVTDKWGAYISDTAAAAAAGPIFLQSANGNAVMTYAAEL